MCSTRRSRVAIHVLSGSGTCCVVLPDARWEEFPEGAPFHHYLSLGLAVTTSSGRASSSGEERAPLVKGAMGTGAQEYYGHPFATTDRATIRRSLDTIGWPNQRPP